MPDPVEVDESLDPVSWLDAGSADQTPALWGLYYAIYYGSKEELLALPDRVLKAYARIQGVTRG